MRPPFLAARHPLAAMLIVMLSPAPAPGQAPAISARTYTSGTATLTVTGAIQMKEDIAINKQASMSDGEMTWLQYGVSGAATPNGLVTVSTQEVGLSFGKGKQIFTIGTEDCAGAMKVTPALVSGEYTCKGVTSYDAASGKMGKVDLMVKFTAGS